MCLAKNKEMERRIGGAIASQGRWLDASDLLEWMCDVWVLTLFDIDRRKPSLLSFGLIC